MLIWVSWFIIGFLCASIILSNRFKMNDEIVVLDLFVFFILFIMGYSSIPIVGLYVLSKYENATVYKRKINEPKINETKTPTKKKIRLLKEEK